MFVILNSLNEMKIQAFISKRKKISVYKTVSAWDLFPFNAFKTNFWNQKVDLDQTLLNKP